MSLTAIQLEGISIQIDGKLILNNVSLEVAEGKCLALLGPSGSGKTTLLRIIAGFIPPQKGNVFLFNRNVKNDQPENRNVSMLFQEPVLFPHLTVKKNATVGFNKNNRHLLQDFEVDRLIKELFVEDFVNRKISDKLSGGERQRAALLRTFANTKQILLLDEPLKSALNVELRWKLMRSIKKLVKQPTITSIIVTHNFEEAAYIADEIAVLEDNGTNLFKEKAYSIYHNPPTLGVARVLGKGNEIEAQYIFNGEMREVNCPFIFENGEPKNQPGAYTVFIRPNKISILRNGNGFKIRSISFTGDVSLVELKPQNVSNEPKIPIFVSTSPDSFSNEDINLDVGLTLNKNDLIVFNQKGERLYDN